MKVKVAEKDDILDGTTTVVEAKGEKILLAKVAGRLYAIEGVCSHRGGELWHGRLDGFVIRCPKHGAEYDIRTGEVVGQVKLPLIGKAQNMRAFPVSSDSTGIYVDI
ncbi:MAG: Sulredoxin [Methanomassiliicoccales archaeon PtaU1.Bin124]|nr:MAG: Sulredoxin [Methanomassiliicoccales archaeon PtaU1.Bin124]